MGKIIKSDRTPGTFGEASMRTLAPVTFLFVSLLFLVQFNLENHPVTLFMVFWTAIASLLTFIYNREEERYLRRKYR